MFDRFDGRFSSRRQTTETKESTVRIFYLHYFHLFISEATQIDQGPSRPSNSPCSSQYKLC